MEAITTERTVLHCDLNNFFASVACKDDPSLAGKAVAVGGSEADRHGIILAKNELAKSFGVKTGEALRQAREKCPELVIVPPDFERYLYLSKQVREIYSHYTDMIEPFGIDECWLDVSGSRSLFGEGPEIAEQLRRRIKNEIGLTISVGVSFCKIFAKIGSDLKKPDAVTVIERKSFKQIVWPLPAGAMIGVGPSASKRLSEMGIYTLGDLAAAPAEALSARLGKNGSLLKSYANGEDSSPVAFEYRTEVPKSIGRSVTCTRDLSTTEEVFNILLRLSEEVAVSLRAKGLAAAGISIHMRTSELEISELQTVLPFPTQLASSLAKNGIELFKRSYSFKKPLRSVGIRAIRLCDKRECRQLSLLYDFEKERREELIEGSMDKIRGKYGKDSICRACTLLPATPETPFKACFNHFTE